MGLSASQFIVDFTGGCSDNPFLDDVFDNFVNVQEASSIPKLAISLAVGGQVANTYGGLMVGAAGLQLYSEYRSGFTIIGLGSRTFAQAAATVGATWAINTVLIKGTYDAFTLIGSGIRTGVNRLAATQACGCKK